MRNYLTKFGTGFFLLLVAFATNVAAQQKTDAVQGDFQKKIVFQHLTLNICEARGRKYKVAVAGDTATVKAEPYEDFGGTVLCFDWQELRSIEAFAKFKFGVLQYLFDDNPAKSLKFSMETPWAALEIDNQSVLIPQSNDNFTGVTTVFEFLGYGDEDTFIADFERRFLSVIQSESLEVQTAFYKATRDPKERTRLEECCPEYIDQAENFLSNPQDVSSLEGLSVEPYRARTTIELRGETKKGEKFVYQIIDEN